MKAIQENQKESRKEFLLAQFQKAAKKSLNVKQHQFWRHDNKPIELWSNSVIKEKIGYIHSNPVAAGLVFIAEDYSRAVDDAGEKGLLDNIFVFMTFD